MNRLRFDGFQKVSGGELAPGFGMFTVMDKAHRLYRSTVATGTLSRHGFTWWEVVEAIEAKEKANG